MSDIFGKVKSAVEAEASKFASAAAPVVEAEAVELAPVAQSFVAAHDLWFVGGAFVLGLVIGLVL